MPDSWKQAYQELKDYVAGHPEIVIGESVTKLPIDVRPGFYEHFNAVRNALMKERMPVLIEASNELSRSFTETETDVTVMLDLQEVAMDTSLHRFLHDPADEMKRGMFGPLFELLKGKLEFEQFEQQAMQATVSSFRPLYREGYEKWVLLSLVKLLAADKLYQIKTRKFSSSEEQTRMGDGQSRELIPPVKEAKSISFKGWADATLTVPDLIVNSPKTGGYVSMRAQYSKALAKALEASKNRKWYTLDSIPPIETDITLVYIDDNIADITLVADVDNICRPDMIIQTKELNGWYEKEGLEKIKPYHYSLKPTLGSYVVSRDAVCEPKSEDCEEDIHLISAGYDDTVLQPIIDALTEAGKKEE